MIHNQKFNMKTVMKSWMKAVAFGCAVILFIACEDTNEQVGQGNVQFEMTDSPTDDANVRNVFVTVTDIKIDGKSIGGVVKTTLDLKAYNEGNTKVLATVNQFDAKAYNNVTLVLDLNTDANGASPGCYVQTYDGSRYQLKNTPDGTTEVTLFKEYEVVSNTTTQVVLDFDIRKAIAYDMDENIRYKFVSDNDLSNSIRMVLRDKSGRIQGSFNEGNGSSNEKVVVYAYKKGTFSASTETQPQGEHQTYFINSTSSTEVKSTLSGREYTLAFLEEGSYELYFASYEESPSGRSTFKGVLMAETSVDGTVGNTINVESGATISISTQIKGIL
jgi:Domain of unknown function (DUF4382)